MRSNVFLTALVFLMIFGLTGCSDTKEKDNDSEEQAPFDSAEVAKGGSRQIGVTLFLTRGFQTSMGGGMGGFSSGGYRYSGSMEVGNPGSKDFVFDTIKVVFESKINNQGHSQKGMLISFTEKGVVTLFLYENKEMEKIGESKESIAKITEKENDPSSVTLKGKRAALFPFSATSSLFPTIIGKEPTRIKVQLFSEGKAISPWYKGVLPSLAKLPDRHKTKNDKEEGFELVLFPPNFVPAPSGVFREDAVERTFQKMKEISEDLRMVKIGPQISTYTIYSTRDGPKARVFPGAWRYYCFSPTKGSYYLEGLDPSVSGKSDLSLDSSLSSITPEVLKACCLDCDAVSFMIESTRAEIKGKGKKSRFELIAHEREGKKRPLWLTPHTIDGHRLGVFADNGEFVFQKRGKWQKVPNVVWN